jgi:hypothetical protein
VPDGDRPSAEPISVAESTEEIPRRRRSARRLLAVAVVAGLCVAAVAIPVALHTSGPAESRRKANPTTKRVNSRQARVQVGAALTATLAAGNYRVHSVMTETAPPGSAASPRGTTIDAVATVNLDPPAMVATANVGSLGVITSWTDSTRQWEQGGANYGLAANSDIGPGQPISGFSGLVVGSLGPREGAASMMSLASPSGYLIVADQAITGASQVGTTTLDGQQLTEYEVTLDAAQLLRRPGMSAEQVKAATDALRLLQQEGYAHTTVRLGIDDAGFVRTSRTVWGFADGGAVTADATLSDFGCAGTVVLPTQAPAPPPPPTCTSPDPAATTPSTAPDSTTAPDTTSPTPGNAPQGTAPQGIGAGKQDFAQLPDSATAFIAYAYAHFFDPKLTADPRLALIQGSAGMRDFIDQSFTRHEAEAAAGQVIVDTVALRGSTADVTFHALYGGAESPANPGQLHGTAVFEDRTWKISRATYCTLSANDGEVCPPE